LKENVIMGRLIPAGTGLEFYRNFKLLTEAEPAQPEAAVQPTPTEPVIPTAPGAAVELADEDEAARAQ
jgi:DNA-directed RNA polymerase subunit beta'